MPVLNCKKISILSVIINLALIGILIWLLVTKKDCTKPPAPGGCSSNQNCPYGKSCINGTCQDYAPPVICRSKNNCPKGYKCVKGKCVLK